MLNVLLIQSDPKNSDIIRVGLEQFQSFEIDRAEDASGVEMAREKEYALIIVDLDLEGSVDGMQVIRQIREFNQTSEIILVTPGRSSRLLSKEKQKQNVFALLPLPITADAFFKLISRVKERLESSGTRPTPKSTEGAPSAPRRKEFDEEQAPPSVR